MTMGRCIALIASYLCRYFCFESISSERFCICTELICICTETADQEGISKVGAQADTLLLLLTYLAQIQKLR